MGFLVLHNSRVKARVNIGYIGIPYPCTNLVQCSPLIVHFTPGTYRLECWGGEGGYLTENMAGKGGYSVGDITLTESTTMYVNIGSHNNGYERSNNGGGVGLNQTEEPPGDTLYYESGGGATDFRLLSNDLSKRLIIAGGGGSQGYWTNDGITIHKKKGGAGGGTEGVTGEIHTEGPQYYNDNIGHGGTQTGPGINNLSGNQNKGGFRGGGGGLFGGAGATYGKGSGGGSGFVFTESSSTPSVINLDTKYYLTNARTIAGDQLIPSFHESKEVTGNTGNGAVRITILESHFNAPIFCTQHSLKRVSFSLILFISIHIS